MSIHNLELNKEAFTYTQAIMPKFMDICLPVLK